MPPFSVAKLRVAFFFILIELTIFVLNQNVMNSPEIKALIRKYRHLFWYIPEDKKEEIDHEVLVEFILNYGDMDAVKDLFRTLGVKESARVFFNSVNKSSRRKQNYNELTLNFFSLYFSKNVF